MVVDEVQWLGELFGHCDLGDVRRTRRLVDVAARLARNAGQSLARCCQGDTAAMLGSYRLIENASVGAEAIAEAGFEAMAQASQTTSGVLLAVEDSTSVVYAHAVTDQLGTTGSQQQPKHRGYLVHSVLLLEASSERTVGLVEQRRWCREDAGYGRKHARKRRAYEDKESYKWQQASERMVGRMGNAMARTISVCDRESDVYEYLRCKHEQAQRYVIRAQSDRGLTQGEQTLFGALAGEQAWQYEATVDIGQRGGRAARKARVQVCGRRVEVKPPADRGKQAMSLPINVVLVREPAGDGSHERLNWVLLTSEPVQTVEHVKRIVRYYELRWRIEEYHKAWKSGVGVERLRQQSPASLERMLAITAFVAVRLLQLREQLPSRPDKDASQAELTCDHILETEEWKVLWLTVRKPPLPATPPTARWACLALASLGGFTDTKRTGRPGWATLWHGWQVLQERVAGFRLATGMAAEV